MGFARAGTRRVHRVQPAHELRRADRAPRRVSFEATAPCHRDARPCTLLAFERSHRKGVCVKKKIRFALLTVAAVLVPSIARAQNTPPPDAKALVEGPKKAPEEPKFEDKVDGTNVTLAAGGMWATGNSRQLAGTANGAFETRWSSNGVGIFLLGNYGQGAAPGDAIRVTAENLQGRVRYDRYVLENASVFLINTGRHDRFQGLDFRYNLDPGVKYLILPAATNTLWAEAGYDLQHDIRRNEDRVVFDANKAPVLDAAGNPQLLDKTLTDHSIRLFAGFKHSFNKEVTLATGLEYLQSVIETTRNRLNFDALFAAKVGGGLALGVGFTARYDHAPLPGKEQLDTASTLSLIYAFSDAAPEPPKCPCPEPAPPTTPLEPTAPSPPPAAPPPADTTPPAPQP